MKILFQSNTVYQLLVVLHLKFSLFKNDDCDIIISNIMNGSNTFYENLKKTNKFTNVYLQNTKGIIVPKINRVIRNKKYDDQYIDLNKFDFKTKYDLFFITNLHLSNLIIYKRLSKMNNVEFCLYEDGLATYSLLYKNIYTLKKGIKKYSSLNYEIKETKKLYVFNPKLMVWKPKQELIEIPSLKNCSEEELRFINTVFGYETFSLPDDCKTIYFEESYLTEGKKVNDLEIIEKCIKKFGNDGFYIKRHPRNRENRFNSLNIKVLDTDSIPWELIVLNNMDRIKDITLLSIDSSTIFNPTLLFGLDVKSYSCENMVNDKKELYDYIPDIVHKLVEQYDNINYLEL